MTELQAARLRPGMKLGSRACDTQIVVVRAPSEPVDLRCGGTPVGVPTNVNDAVGLAAGFDGGSLLGKRYEDPDVGLEVLCVRPGAGALSIGRELLKIKASKPLPSSD
jgi:hypothetical protein